MVKIINRTNITRNRMILRNRNRARKVNEQRITKSSTIRWTNRSCWRKPIWVRWYEMKSLSYFSSFKASVCSLINSVTPLISVLLAYTGSVNRYLLKNIDSIWPDIIYFEQQNRRISKKKILSHCFIELPHWIFIIRYSILIYSARTTHHWLVS